MGYQIGAGRLFNSKSGGTGLVAITANHDLLTGAVAPNEEIMTIPNETETWSGSLVRELQAGVLLKTFMERGSAKSLHMSFQSNGFISILQWGETHFQAA